MENLYARLAEILEVPEVKPTDTLADFEAWDSLSILSTITMLDSHYGIRANAADLKALATAGDLEKLVRARKGNK